jgi:hypothetical protein
VQGVIAAKDLPPIIKKQVTCSNPRHLGHLNKELYRPAERQRPYLRQSVELTGFGSKQFQASINTLHRLWQTLARQVPEGAMEKLAVSQINGFDTIQLAT